MSLFDRVQVFSTFSMDAQARYRSALERNGIEYKLKTVNRRSASPFGNGTRSYTGSFGEDQSLAYEYVFYVRRRDRDAAKSLI